MSINRDGEWQGHSTLLHIERQTVGEIVGKWVSKVVELAGPAKRDVSSASEAVLQITQTAPELLQSN